MVQETEEKSTAQHTLPQQTHTHTHTYMYKRTTLHSFKNTQGGHTLLAHR